MTTKKMDDVRALRLLAKEMGVFTRYTDGLGKRVIVGPETLLRVCAALGAPLERPHDAVEALKERHSTRKTKKVPPVIVAWDGVPPLPLRERGSGGEGLPFGYHRTTIDGQPCTIISAPTQAWRRPGNHKSWGVGTQLAALRSSRSRSVADLRDFAALCRWVREKGGDLVTALPLLPTFNTAPPEPSPYSPVSRLFWTELMLDLGSAHHPTAAPERLDVIAANAEVRAALANHPAPADALLDDELRRYARFRGAQARLGRNWRDWPADARSGKLTSAHVTADEERFHLVAQIMLRHQLHDLRENLENDGMRVGLDLAVGVHPDGYDPWSRQELFGDGMSVGAPPDQGFPSGQDWGFSPVLPDASRREGHRYLAASIAHQAELAGVLRVDHIMAWTRLYWIPHGMGLHQGTYVTYPAEELFAILTLESHLHRCEVVGENLGTVPKDIFEALPRHRIWGMYLAEFQASSGPHVAPPPAADMALIGTHDTPTFAGWIAGNDIVERVKYGLLKESAVDAVGKERHQAVHWLAAQLKQRAEEPRPFLAALLEWLGRSESPLVVPWLEDLWLEERGVNLPGTPSSQRPNWQLPMARLLEDIFSDSQVDEFARILKNARVASSG
jgi:4-alpha-glucanotransferase